MQFDTSSTYRSMRSSLYPFVRNQDQQPDDERPDIKQQNGQPKLFKKSLLSRYHDQSYVVKQKQPNNVQKYAKILNKINSLFSLNTKKLQLNQYNQIVIQQKQTLNPDSRILFIWNLLVAISILFHLFQIPISVFFTSRVYQEQFSSSGGIASNCISLTVLLLNIVYVIPNTQYYHNGFLVTSHQKIIRRYLGWRMALDSYCWIAAFVYAVSNTYVLIYWKVSAYLMVYRLIKVDEALQKKIQLTKIRLATYKLIRILLMLLMLIVWLGSIFFAIDYHYYIQGADSQYQGETYLWLMGTAATNDTDLVANYDWTVWFVYALYWSVSTVTMVGFGDITPKNPNQVIFVSIVITCIVISYAFFITGVWQIISEARQFNTYQVKQWKVYKQYQKQNMKPLDKKKYVVETGTRYRQLKNKVGSYLFEMWSHQKVYTQTNVVYILQKSLTHQLKDEVFINYRQHLFQRIKLFTQLANSQKKYYNYIFRQLIFKIRQKKYARNQEVIQQNQINQNLIYLVNGTMKLFYPKSHYERTFKHSFADIKNKPVNNYMEDQNYNFGVKQFFTQQRIPYSVISQSFCKTSQLSYSDFIHSLKQIQQFYYKYCELRDNVKYYNEDSLTGQQCIQCGSKQHDLNQCKYCDIVMSHRKNYMKIAKVNLLNKEQNKQKAPKMAFKRKFIKSNKLLNPSIKLNRQFVIDQVKTLTSYYPDHNL